MTKRPIIGITGNESKGKESWENGITRTYTSKIFSDIIMESGGLPIVLPIAHPDFVEDYVSSIDKLMLTGGQHVLPHFYGEKRSIQSDDYNEARDLYELRLVEETLKQGKPILGICRGLQLVNVALGGRLNQMLANHWHETAPSRGHQTIRIADQSILHDIFGDYYDVNSLHLQSIKTLATDLEAIAWDSNDQTIEAVISRRHAILGLQWHPELMVRQDPVSQKIFDYFVNEMA